MLTRPLLTEGEERGRGLVSVTPPSVVPLADKGDDSPTGVSSHPAPPWSSSSPPTPHCASSSSCAHTLTPLSLTSTASFSPSAPALSSSTSPSLSLPVSPVSPPHPDVLSPLSSAPSTCSPPLLLLRPSPPGVLICSAPPVAPSFISQPPAPPAPVTPPSLAVLSSSYAAPSSFRSPSLASPHFLYRSSSFCYTRPSPVFHNPSPTSSSAPPLAPPYLPFSSLLPCALSATPPSAPPPSAPLASAPAPSAPHPSAPPSSPPPPPTAPSSPSSAPSSPPTSVSSPPSDPPSHPASTLSPHSSAPSSPVSAPFPPTNAAPPSARTSPPPSAAPPPASPCCSCSSLLPRLLSAHRREMQRLLLRAVSSLGRRLDALEKRSRRRGRKRRSRQRRQEDEGGGASSSASTGPAPSISHTPACGPGHPSPVSSFSSSSSSSSSSGSEGSPMSPLPPPSGMSQSGQSRSKDVEEEERGRRRKRKRKSHRGGEMRLHPANREDDEEEEEEEEEEEGRFVGRMMVSKKGDRGTEEEVPLTLHKFNHRKRRRRVGPGTSQSEKAASIVVNGYRAPLRPHISSSQDALQLQNRTSCSQSDALSVSPHAWCFSDFTMPLTLSSNHSVLQFLLRPSCSFNPAPMLRLSAVTVEKVTDGWRGGSTVSPTRLLKDWTAPPTLGIDHCYVRSSNTHSTALSAWRQQKPRANHSSRTVHPAQRRPLPPCSANGLAAPLPSSQSAESSSFLRTKGESGKRVSQIRIRRASPRETLLTPMGLPKVKRLKKKEFSLEEIYTNKNYKSPSTNRSLETIFEEPREKDGALLLIGQQRRRRLLLFPDFTQPRKRKRPQGAGLPVAMAPRKRAAARRQCSGSVEDDSDLDVMLVERLSALEDFLLRQGLDV